MLDDARDAASRLTADESQKRNTEMLGKLITQLTHSSGSVLVPARKLAILNDDGGLERQLLVGLVANLGTPSVTVRQREMGGSRHLGSSAGREDTR